MISYDYSIIQGDANNIPCGTIICLPISVGIQNLYSDSDRSAIITIGWEAERTMQIQIIHGVGIKTRCQSDGIWTQWG